MDAHFQIGITREYAFVWLSVIDQPKNQQQIARCWSEKPALFETLPQDFVLSLDHTQYGYQPIREWPAALERLTTVKKSELQIGKVYLKESDFYAHYGATVTDYFLLLPLYRNRRRVTILRPRRELRKMERQNRRSQNQPPKKRKIY